MNNWSSLYQVMSVQRVSGYYEQVRTKSGKEMVRTGPGIQVMPRTRPDCVQAAYGWSWHCTTITQLNSVNNDKPLLLPIKTPCARWLITEQLRRLFTKAMNTLIVGSAAADSPNSLSMNQFMTGWEYLPLVSCLRLIYTCNPGKPLYEAAQEIVPIHEFWWGLLQAKGPA
jgi:hypothetical protein